MLNTGHDNTNSCVEHPRKTQQHSVASTWLSERKKHLTHGKCSTPSSDLARKHADVMTVLLRKERAHMPLDLHCIVCSIRMLASIRFDSSTILELTKISFICLALLKLQQSVYSKHGPVCIGLMLPNVFRESPSVLADV